MTRWLLDTNVISELVKPSPSASLMAWIAERRDSELYIASISIAEIRQGILLKDEGRKRRELEAWFEGPHGPPLLFSGRVFSFDLPAALRWAELMVEGRRRGQARPATDMMIAATALVNDCTMVTGNERHFRDVVPMLNPMRSEG